MKIEKLQSLHQLFEQIIANKKVTEITKELGLNQRQITDQVKILRDFNLPIFFKKSEGKYQCSWPLAELQLELDQRELFFLYMTLQEAQLTASMQKLQNNLDFNSHTFTDLSKSALENAIHNKESAQLLKGLAEAIRNRRQVCINYKKADGTYSSERILHPYRIVGTPQSLYLIAYCPERGRFLTFKLSRMKSLRTLEKLYPVQFFDLETWRGDAFYLRKKEHEKHTIKIIFHGKAAHSITEYKVHKSQKNTILDEQRTLVTWQISDLTEITSWLMGWLGDIEIVEPVELQASIDQKIKNFQDLNKPRNSQKEEIYAG